MRAQKGSASGNGSISMCAFKRLIFQGVLVHRDTLTELLGSISMDVISITKNSALFLAATKDLPA